MSNDVWTFELLIDAATVYYAKCLNHRKTCDPYQSLTTERAHFEVTGACMNNNKPDQTSEME